MTTFRTLLRRSARSHASHRDELAVQRALARAVTPAARQELLALSTRR